MRDAAAIIGIGQTEFSKAAGRSETQLAVESILAAVLDSGLSVADVDGLVSYTIDPVEEAELARSIGFSDIHFSSRVPYGGGGSQGVLLHAAAAVVSGAADVVVAYRAIKARSGERFGRAGLGNRSGSSHSGTTATQWCMPFGVLTPASWMSLNAVRYMHSYGVTSEDFGRLVVQERSFAANNPNAHFYKKPITLEEHQASRWIAEPAIHLFDCCQETDGSVAIVVTRADRAKSIDGSVLVAGAAGSAAFEEEIASNHYTPDITVMEGTRAMADRLFELAGITRTEIDVAMIYDAFSPMFLMQLEALGYCGFGEAKDFIADGNLALDGQLPCNTNGGLIGEGYIHGLNLTLEAVRQLRSTSRNQVEGAQTALVAAGRTGVILRKP